MYYIIKISLLSVLLKVYITDKPSMVDDHSSDITHFKGLIQVQQKYAVWFSIYSLVQFKDLAVA
jgi:hypothetical protein